jgi:hypothetical protein
VVQVGGGGGGQRLSAGAQASHHVRDQQVRPFVSGDKPPGGQFLGRQAHPAVGLALADRATVEQEVGQRGSAVGLRGYPVDNQQPAGLQVEAEFLLDLAGGGLPGALAVLDAAAGDLQLSPRSAGCTSRIRPSWSCRITPAPVMVLGKVA